jgi:hypothetical protein
VTARLRAMIVERFDETLDSVRAAEAVGFVPRDLGPDMI